MTLGRGMDCEFVLDQPSISRKHAMLRKIGEHFVVEDLDTGNGTLVNGQKVFRHYLQHNDVVSIGDYRIIFHCNPFAPKVETETPVTPEPILAETPSLPPTTPTLAPIPPHLQEPFMAKPKEDLEKELSNQLAQGLGTTHSCPPSFPTRPRRIHYRRKPRSCTCAYACQNHRAFYREFNRRRK